MGRKYSNKKVTRFSGNTSWGDNVPEVGKVNIKEIWKYLQEEEKDIRENYIKSKKIFMDISVVVVKEEKEEFQGEGINDWAIYRMKTNE